MRLLCLSLLLHITTARVLLAEDAIELRHYVAPEATQAVAVDREHFYAIGNQVIGKYDKNTGKLVNRWTASEKLPLVHLNSGIVLNSELICAHSNFPSYPEVSSIEIWDTQNLEHVRSHSLGICEGSLTWVDWHDDAWWAVFGHYSEKVNDDPHAKDARWTSLVKFDREWRRMAGWVFPQEVVARFEPHSCSGGAWARNGMLYCTGHDRGELYELALPHSASTLRLVETWHVPITGQGFAWDTTVHGKFFGINRPLGQVVAVQLPSLTSANLQTARRTVDAP